MTGPGFPSHDLGPDEPELKLGPDASALRAARPRPARFNGRIAAFLATGAAVFVVGAIFVPGLVPKSHKAHDKTPATSSPTALPTLPAVCYGGPMAAEPVANGGPEASPGTSGAGFDCAQYPGLPGCAGLTPVTQAPAAQPGAVSAQAASGPAVAALGPAPITVPGSNTPQAARSSGLFFGGPLGGAANAVAVASGPAPAAVAPQSPVPLAGPPGFAPSAPQAREPADVMGQNGQGEKAAFQRSTVSQDYVAGHLEKVRSPYEVKAGSVIPAALMTTINSDLPGEVIAQVTQPVYDHVTGRYVLIPQGSRLIGRYDSQVAYGQNRAMVVWTRVIFPNGASINFGNMTGTDPSGASGVADQVNDHFGQLARGIVLSSLLSMGAASAQSAQARTSGAIAVNAGASGVATETQAVGSRIAERDMNRQPTIVIRAGAQMRVLVSKDMVLEPYAS